MCSILQTMQKTTSTVQPLQHKIQGESGAPLTDHTLKHSPIFTGKSGEAEHQVTLSAGEQMRTGQIPPTPPGAGPLAHSPQS